LLDLAGERGDLARGGTVVIDLEGEPARLRGVGVDDALPDRRAQHRRIVIGQRLGRLASDDSARAATVEDKPRGKGRGE